MLQYNPVTGVWEAAHSGAVLGAHNAARLPGYLRLDVAARRSYSRRWFGRPVTVTPFAQVLNVLNTRNVLIGEAQVYGSPRMSYMPQLPFLPSFGLEWNH
jgi:hypothetical protein